jgi:hypothetical protein
MSDATDPSIIQRATALDDAISHTRRAAAAAVAATAGCYDVHRERRLFDAARRLNLVLVDLMDLRP